LSPKNAFLYFHRGEVYEKKGELELAAADYKKALEVDPANESAKLAASRVEAAQAKLLPKVEPAPAKPTVTAAPLPEFLYLGTLSESTAIKMVKPVYSQTAIKLNIGGKVSVDVELDTKGNVTSAKASNGSPYLRKDSEIAAMACKFKPAMVGDQPVKGKGIITYNFVPPTR
jgi:TonB family protein